MGQNPVESLGDKKSNILVDGGSFNVFDVSLQSDTKEELERLLKANLNSQEYTKSAIGQKFGSDLQNLNKQKGELRSKELEYEAKTGTANTQIYRINKILTTLQSPLTPQALKETLEAQVEADKKELDDLTQTFADLNSKYQDTVGFVDDNRLQSDPEYQKAVAQKEAITQRQQQRQSNINALGDAEYELQEANQVNEEQLQEQLTQLTAQIQEQEQERLQKKIKALKEEQEDLDEQQKEARAKYDKEYDGILAEFTKYIEEERALEPEGALKDAKEQGKELKRGKNGATVVQNSKEENKGQIKNFLDKLKGSATLSEEQEKLRDKLDKALKQINELEEAIKTAPERKDPNNPDIKTKAELENKLDELHTDVQVTHHKGPDGKEFYMMRDQTGERNAEGNKYCDRTFTSLNEDGIGETQNAAKMLQNGQGKELDKILNNVVKGKDIDSSGKEHDSIRTQYKTNTFKIGYGEQSVEQQQNITVELEKDPNQQQNITVELEKDPNQQKNITVEIKNQAEQNIDPNMQAARQQVQQDGTVQAVNGALNADQRQQQNNQQQQVQQQRSPSQGMGGGRI